MASGNQFSVQSLPSPAPVAVMTGATSGIGAHALYRILQAEPELGILLVARRSGNASVMRQLLSQTHRVEFIWADLASLGSVDQACREVVERLRGRPLSALVLNAGVQATTDHQTSKDGLELAFAVNHLAHFLMTQRLHKHMAPGGRVVITASEVHDPEAFCIAGTTRAKWQDPIELADPALSQVHIRTRRRRGEARYSASKLLNVMHARHLAATRADLTVVSFNPSVVPGTDIARDRGWLLHNGWKYVVPAVARWLPGMRSIETSASDLAWLATAALPAEFSGCYVNGRRCEPGSADSRNPSKIGRLIEVSHKICHKLCPQSTQAKGCASRI